MGFLSAQQCNLQQKVFGSGSLLIQKNSGKVLVLLDTEGLADPEKGDATHDAKIFCLALLLSSTFVYNSKGTIDNNALQDLQMTTDI